MTALMRTELQENRDVENNRRSEKRWTEHQDDRTKVDKTTGERAHMERTTEEHKKDGHTYVKQEAKTKMSRKKGGLIQKN
jgi:hypothetical protein